MFGNSSTLQQLYTNPHWWTAADRMRNWSECLFQHSLAVADLALAVGRELGASRREQAILQTAGFLHDLGKVAWPRCLVDKYPLSDTDWQIIRVHPLVGAELAVELQCTTDDTVLRLIREHHEHGANGYPTGTADLNPLSRILVVGEVFMAMTEDRPYRPVSMSGQAALNELAQNGHDGQVLSALRKTLISQQNELRRTNKCTPMASNAWLSR